MLSLVNNRIQGVLRRRETQRVRRQQLLEMRAQVLRDLEMAHGLLRDQRYARYTSLLQEARSAFERERNGYLVTAKRSDDHALEIARLTGKIEMIDWVLHCHEHFEQVAAWLAESHARTSETLDPITPRGRVSPT